MSPVPIITPHPNGKVNYYLAFIVIISLYFFIVLASDHVFLETDSVLPILKIVSSPSLLIDRFPLHPFLLSVEESRQFNLCFPRVCSAALCICCSLSARSSSSIRLGFFLSDKTLSGCIVSGCCSLCCS